MNKLQLGKAAQAEFDKAAARIGEYIWRSYRVVTNTGIDDDGASVYRMRQIIADNPEMVREQAFLQAVMENAERTL